MTLQILTGKSATAEIYNFNDSPWMQCGVVGVYQTPLGNGFRGCGPIMKKTMLGFCGVFLRMCFWEVLCICCNRSRDEWYSCKLYTLRTRRGEKEGFCVYLPQHKTSHPNQTHNTKHRTQNTKNKNKKERHTMRHITFSITPKSSALIVPHQGNHLQSCQPWQVSACKYHSFHSTA